MFLNPYNMPVIRTFSYHFFLYLLLFSRSLGVESGVKQCLAVVFGVNGVKRIPVRCKSASLTMDFNINTAPLQVNDMKLRNNRRSPSPRQDSSTMPTRFVWITPKVFKRAAARSDMCFKPIGKLHGSAEWSRVFHPLERALAGRTATGPSDGVRPPDGPYTLFCSFL